MANMKARVRQREAAEHDAWFRRQVQAGLDSANAGRLILAAEVEARFSEKRAATAAGVVFPSPDLRPRRYDQRG